MKIDILFHDQNMYRDQLEQKFFADLQQSLTIIEGCAGSKELSYGKVPVGGNGSRNQTNALDSLMNLSFGLHRNLYVADIKKIKTTD